MQVEAPAAEYLFGLHVLQMGEPLPVENVPAGQLAHGLPPLEVWPAGQLSQPVWSALICVPGLQGAQMALLPGEYVFAGQAVQDVAPPVE